MDRPSRRERLVRLLVVAAVGVLAVYPIHARHLHLELQEHFPRNAVVAVAENDWAPFGLHHGAAFFDLLRAVYSVWFGIGHLVGAYPTRLHFLAEFLRDPFPFVLVGRGAVLAIAALGYVLVVRSTSALFGRTAAFAALALLGVTFGWVRGLHHVWIDVPSSVVAVAAVMAALRLQASGTPGAAVGAGLVAGMALATKHSTFPIAATVAVAALLGPSGGLRTVLTRLVAGGMAMAGAFFVLSPYALIKWRETLATLEMLNRILFAAPPVASLTLADAVGYGAGWGIPLLASVGLAAALVATPRPAIVLASFPLCYLVVVARANAVYLRHLTALWPFMALFAGYGAVVIARRLAPRRAAAVAAVVVALAAASPAWRSVGYDRLLARRDTRDMAGEWIRANVPAGTPLVLPNAVRYPNPVLPPSPTELRLEYPRYAKALGGPGFPPLGRHPTTFLAAFDRFAEWKLPPGAYVVEAYHPAVLTEMNFPPALREDLRAAGAEVAARFTAVPTPLPADVVYDPLDADYLPLAGFRRVERPGPNVTIWVIPEGDDRLD